MLAPPARTRVLLTWELRDDTDLRLVRAGLLRYFTSAEAGDQAGDQAGDPAVADSMGLVMTELAGNALRHGTPPVLVRLLSDDDCYILDVSDHATDGIPVEPAPQPNVQAGGRGLRIALTIAHEVCWHVNGDTKHVWASFPTRRQSPG